MTGVIGHRLRLDPLSVVELDGLPVPPVAETWAQLGGLLGVDDLVVAADHILGRPGATSLAELRSATARLRRRGAVNLGEAIELARKGSESPRETLTRLVLVRAGLPEPLLNWELRTPSGLFVARLDMAYPRFRLAVEYDGRQHAETVQFGRDADRWAAIEAQGWRVVRVLSHHFARPERDIALRTRQALRARGWDGLSQDAC